MKRKKLIDFFRNYWGQEFLEKWQKKDEYLPNGLQIKGSDEIRQIALGVSVNQDFLNHALHWGADTCIFHHALGLNFPQHVVSEHFRVRLKLILEKNLNVFGFHGAMDAHPQHGHSALILKKLNAKIISGLYEDWGWYGDLSQRAKLVKIGEKCHQIFNHEVFVVGKPGKLIKRIGVVTGGGTPSGKSLFEVIQKGIDLYLSGEIKESIPHTFSENNMAYLSCGHYATEKIGLLHLEKNLKKAFPKLKIKFIDIPNPL